MQLPDEQPGGAVGLLRDIRPEPDGLPRGQGVGSQSLDGVHGGVDVADGLPAHDIAQVFDGERTPLGVGGSGIVDQAHVLREVEVDVAVQELQWGQRALAVEDALVVAPLPVEGGGRLAQADDQDAPDLGQDLVGGDADVLLRGSPVHQVTHLQGAAAQEDLELGVHAVRVGGGLGLRHGLLRHDPVLEVDGHGHVPLPAVPEHLGQHELHEAGVQGFPGGRDDVLEEEVGALELVPEHRMVLGELEVLDPQVGPCTGTQQVEGGEEPAAAGLLLGGHLPVVEALRHDRGGAHDAFAGQRGGVDTGSGHGVHGQTQRPVPWIGGAQVVDHRLRDRCWGVSRIAGRCHGRCPPVVGGTPPWWASAPMLRRAGTRATPASAPVADGPGAGVVWGLRRRCVPGGGPPAGHAPRRGG